MIIKMGEKIMSDAKENTKSINRLMNFLYTASPKTFL